MVTSVIACYISTNRRRGGISWPRAC